MIVIYTQDETYIHNNADEAKTKLITEYGEKLGQRAFETVKNAPVGTRYRENGGPLVCVVDKEKPPGSKKKKPPLVC